MNHEDKKIIKMWEDSALNQACVNNDFYWITRHFNKQNIVYVDVGANTGTLFDRIDSLYHVEKAILFEPQPKLFEYLKEKYKQDKRVIVENNALSDSIKSYILYDDTEIMLDTTKTLIKDPDYILPEKGYISNDGLVLNLALSKINFYKENVESELKTATFDSIRNKYNLERIDLIKIDTENNDVNVCFGFWETLNNLDNLPAIFIENNIFHEHGINDASLNKLYKFIDFCKRHGYGTDGLVPRLVNSHKQGSNTNLFFEKGNWYSCS